MNAFGDRPSGAGAASLAQAPIPVAPRRAGR